MSELQRVLIRLAAPGAAWRAGSRAGTLLVAFVALAPLAPLGCANCNDKPAAKLQRRVAPPQVDEIEGQPHQPPQLPPGQPMSGEVFRKFAPDNVAGFVAEGQGEVLSSPLANGGTLTTFSRNYKRGAQTLRLEYSDGLHAPLLVKVIKQQQGKNRKTELSDFQGVAVAGFPSVLQYQGNARTAYANVLVSERVLLNARVVPADDIQSAVEVASALPLKAIAALIPATDAGVTDPAAEPAEGKAKPLAPAVAPADAKPGSKPKHAPAGKAPVAPKNAAVKPPG